MNFINELFKYQNNTEVIGLTDELNVFCVLNRFNQGNKNTRTAGIDFWTRLGYVHL